MRDFNRDRLMIMLRDIATPEWDMYFMHQIVESYLKAGHSVNLRHTYNTIRHQLHIDALPKPAKQGKLLEFRKKA
jgi:hypothetical protein